MGGPAQSGLSVAETVRVERAATVAPAQGERGARTIGAAILRNAVIVALVLLFLWLTVQIDFIIFAGLLLGIFLRGLADLVTRWTRLPVGISLALVVLGIVIILAGIGWFFNAQINSQINQLAERLPAAFHSLQQSLEKVPWVKNILAHVNPTNIVSSGGGAGRIAGSIFGIATTTIEVVVGVIIFLFIGLYTAAEPDTYANGFIRLFPMNRRARARTILQETAATLWYWMMGRLFSMTTIGLCTGIGLWIIGVPLPAALGALAGILTFVPYVGTIISAFPPGLIALTTDPKLVIWIILLYVGIHSLEGYILVPLVQKRAAHLPPALTLAAQAVLGVLVGFLGLALATPLVAAGLVLTRMIYVEDVLGDRSVAEAKRG